MQVRLSTMRRSEADLGTGNGVYASYSDPQI
jgi:hypothetical protein